MVFFIDEAQVASHAIAIATNMRLTVSDEVGGNVLAVDWLGCSLSTEYRYVQCQ